MLRRHFINQLIGGLAIAGVANNASPRAFTQRNSPAQLSDSDTILINEAYHLWQTLGGSVWTGWTEISVPILYITQEHEYAIGFPAPMRGFQPIARSGFGSRIVQSRPLVLSRELSASFPIEGTSAVVIGTPAALQKSPEAWVLTAVHEMFHVLQFARGEAQKVNALNLGSQSDGSWQLNFPFPYTDANVMRLIHLQGYPLYLAVTSADETDTRYNAGTAYEAAQVYQAFLRTRSADDRFYKYSQFQEWKEGIASYTEYRMAEAAAANYQPTAAFRQLADFKGYAKLWEESYKNRKFLIKHAGRAARNRTAFYHLGLGKGLLLDRLMSDWKTRYFAPDVWLDDLLKQTQT